MAEDSERIAELFSAYGPVEVRRMFGGAGVFADGLMIALSVDGVLFLKADGATIPEFEREGLRPFSYQTKVRPPHADILLADAGTALRRAG